MADGIQQVDLVGRSRGAELITSATDKMVEGLRAGFITANDIIERGSERNKAKEKMEIALARQATADATDPALIEARRNQQLAQGAAAGSALALNPLVEQAKTAELKAAIFDAQSKPGGFDLMQNALSKAGFPVSVDPNTGLTDANKNEIIKRFSALQDYTLKLTDAEESVKNIETKFFPTEQKLPDGSTTKGQLQKLFRNGQEITSDELKSSAQKSAALKRTPFSQWYSLQDTKPGQVVTPVAAPAPVAPVITISPVEAAQQRAQLINARVPNAASLPDQQVASLIQPAAPVSAAPPVIQPAAPTPQIGQTAPGIGIVTSVEAAPTPVPLRPTEGQQRALLAVPRFQEANAALNDLKTRDYDPTSWLSWVDSYLPQIAKSGDRKEFETAMSVWSQGLLRLESGAAITPKEQGWYEKAFFPVVGDPPTVLRQKEALRHSVEGMVAELGSAGPIGQELKERAQGVFKAAETFAPVSSTVATPTGATENSTVVNGQTFRLRVDPATGQKKYFIVR